MKQQLKGENPTIIKCIHRQEEYSQPLLLTNVDNEHSGNNWPALFSSKRPQERAVV